MRRGARAWNLVDFENYFQYLQGHITEVLLLVCHCHRICDRTIRESMRQGASSVAEIGAACRAGTGCGGCRPAIAGLLSAHRAERSPERAVSAAGVIALRLAS